LAATATICEPRREKVEPDRDRSRSGSYVLSRRQLFFEREPLDFRFELDDLRELPDDFDFERVPDDFRELLDDFDFDFEREPDDFDFDFAPADFRELVDFDFVPDDFDFVLEPDDFDFDFDFEPDDLLVDFLDPDEDFDFDPDDFDFDFEPDDFDFDLDFGPEDFDFDFEPDDEDFVSPAFERALLTVRAAISFARSVDSPFSSSESLTCSYWRSRFSLHAC
jgi:hypothetical protein